MENTYGTGHGHKQGRPTRIPKDKQPKISVFQNPLRIRL
jgi:hypothetical protein